MAEHPYEPDEVGDLKAEVRVTSSVDLLEDFLSVTASAETGRPPELNPWEFRATWQELERRGFIRAQ